MAPQAGLLQAESKYMNSVIQTELTQKPSLFPQKYSPSLRTIIEEFDPLLQEPEDTFGLLLNQLLTRIEAEPSVPTKENPSNTGLIPRNGKRNSRNNRQHNQAVIYRNTCQQKALLSQQ